MQIKENQLTTAAELQELLKAKETIAEQILNNCYLPTRETIPQALDSIYTVFWEMYHQDIENGEINASSILNTLIVISNNYISTNPKEKLTQQDKFSSIVCGMFDNVNNLELIKSFYYLDQAISKIMRLEQ